MPFQLKKMEEDIYMHKNPTIYSIFIDPPDIFLHYRKDRISLTKQELRPLKKLCLNLKSSNVASYYNNSK